MSQTWSSNSSNGSLSESESINSRSRPFVRRPNSTIIAALSAGRPALTAANLANNDKALPNKLREYHAPGKVQSIESAAASLGFELPTKTKAQLMESYLETTPATRFQYGTEGGIGGPVNARSWERLVAHDPVAADIDSEVRRLKGN